MLLHCDISKYCYYIFSQNHSPKQQFLYQYTLNISSLDMSILVCVNRRILQQQADTIVHNDAVHHSTPQYTAIDEVTNFSLTDEVNFP